MSMTINSMNSLFSGIFGWNSQNSANSSQTMFGQDANLGINLSDYASIKSGAYHKLLKLIMRMSRMMIKRRIVLPKRIPRRHRRKRWRS